ncbi:fatty acid desaturase [Persicitalea jodogahamensis]|uniref:fatty acid desaturase n=1 Tax=Persicitalea jodogahamensis TaxID=402147 RepID=UPI00167684E1|nr:fatty acid desaturase [Persicitalea jodogahamensis]
MCTYAHYYYLYPLLLVANLLNVYWGEFKNSELLEELRYFYCSKTSYYLKCLNAIVLLGLIALGNAFVDSKGFSLGYLLGFGITTGLLSGCFIVTLAHDLLHSRSRLQKVLSVLLLTMSGIPHFATEHVFGHHRYIGLKKDVTTAKLNEDFYTYFCKVTLSNLKAGPKMPYLYFMMITMALLPPIWLYGKISYCFGCENFSAL